MKSRTTFFSRTLIVCIIFVGLLLRLYRIQNPIADWHSFRQADTASVTREFLQKRIDLLHPTYHDLSNIQSGMDNPQGYRMVEFPIVNAFSALVIQLTRTQAYEVLVQRMLSVVFSLITLICIYVIGKKISHEHVGLFAALMFAILPYSVYYSRVILPEPFVLAFIMLTAVFFLLWEEKKKLQWVLLSGICFMLALLIKPFAVFYLPFFFSFGIWNNTQKFSLKKLFVYGLYSIFSFIPLLAWRFWIRQFPEGIPASGWLLNTENIRFSGAFFHWIFEVRISTLMLGIGGVVFAVLGMIKKGKSRGIYLVGVVSMLAYLFVVAGGNVQHDYYQVLLLPILCLLCGRGMQFILELSKQHIQPTTAKMSIVFLLAFSLFVSWYSVRGYFNVNHWEIVEAGTAVDTLIPKSAKVIAPFMGDTAFLFQTKRSGWPIGFSIQEKIDKGAQYYVTVNVDDEAEELFAKYATVKKTDRYLILDLLHPL